MLFRKLQGRLREYGITQKSLAKILKVSPTYIGNRLSGAQGFTIDHIYVICDLLEIPLTDIPIYFPPNGKDVKKGA